MIDAALALLDPPYAWWVGTWIAYKFVAARIA